MGCSMSQENYEKLQRFEREGRVCSVATTRWREEGGTQCFGKATRKLVEEATNWDNADGVAFDTGHEVGYVSALPVCPRHAAEAQRTADYYDGMNCRGYRLVNVETF